MGFLSNRINLRANTQFRTDQNGKLIFLPFGPRKTGYVIESKPDEQNIRSLATMNATAATLVTLFGILSSYLLAWALAFSVDPASKDRKYGVFVGVYLVAVLVFQGAPLWILRNVYKETLRSFTASLNEVGPEAVRQMAKIPRPSGSKLPVVVFVASLLLLGIAIFALTSRTH
jgi:hypothetical protein